MTSHHVLMNQFTLEPKELVDAQIAAVSRVVRSGWYVLGDEGKRFEAKYAQWSGLARVAGVGNGMDALEIGLRAAGLGPGDEIVTTPMTAFATVLAVVRAGATPVFADIDSRTGMLDLESVDRCLTRRTKAVIVVHLYGQSADMGSWTRFCADRGIALIEDCAQAHGARWEGKPVGSFGIYGAFSFYPTKNLGSLGDGGAIAASTQALDARVRVIRNYGQRTRYIHDEIGQNSRLDEMQAAILSERLSWVDRFIARRRQVAAQYHAGIRNPRVVPLPPPVKEENHTYHLFVVTCPERDRLSAFLGDRGVETHVHYPIPAHRQKPAASFGCDPSGLRRAEKHAEECLSIPCHPQLSDVAVNAVVKALNDFR